MLLFKLRAKAKTDLKRIARFTEKHWGRAQRNEYLMQLDACFHKLSKNPYMGQECNYIRPGCRKFPMESHLVFYEIRDDETVLVIRVLRKHMDVSPDLFGE